MVHNFYLSLSPLFHPPLLSSPKPVEAGSAGGFILKLTMELFLSTVAKVLLIVGTVWFLCDF